MDIRTSEKSSKEKKQVRELHDTKRQKLWIGGYLLLAVACLLLYFLFRLEIFDVIGTYRNILLKLLLAAATCFWNSDHSQNNARHRCKTFAYPRNTV